ncbi:MAG: hypothetical protein N2A42_11280 [Luteolibacter sp.]
MRILPNKLRRGFTILELTVAMMVGMTVGATILAMLNQQVAFLKIFKAQSFLNEEAPIISNHISKLLLGAERFRLHATVEDALAGANPRLTDSPVCVLNFRQPDGSVRAGILSFEDRGQGDALYYYLVPLTGTLVAPEWAITTMPTLVTFSVESGIIRTRLTGPAGEELTFSGAMQ